MERITRTKAALEEAGHEVVLDISMDIVGTAEVEESKAARVEDRVAALEAKAVKKHAEADAAYHTHESAMRALPPMGEPIKVGHHSESGHRAALARSDRATRTWLTAETEATEIDRRATVAARATQKRYSPVTVQNRINKLEADILRLNREILRNEAKQALHWDAGMSPELMARSLAALSDAQGKVEYWRGVREQQKAEGIRSYGPENIAKGDMVSTNHGRTWDRVVRVNRKTVTVSVGVMHGMEMLYDFVRITDVKEMTE